MLNYLIILSMLLPSISFSKTQFVDHSLMEIDLDKVENSTDLMHFRHKVFDDISSSYKGVEKSCMYTLPPEENKLFFGKEGKYTRLKNYYDLKNSLASIKKGFSPENDPEYKERKENFEESKQTIKKMFDQMNERIPKKFVRHDQMKEMLADYSKFEEFVLKRGDSKIGWDLPGIPRHGAVRDAIRSIKREFQDDRKVLQKAYSHFRDYKSNASYNSAEAKKKYQEVRSELSFLKADKYLKKWLSENSEEDVKEAFKKKASYKRDKRLNIMFEGTGQYSPVFEKNLKTLQASIGMEANQETIDKANSIAIDISSDKSYFNTQGGNSTWSGTIRGPISKGLYRAPTKEDPRNLRGSQWLYLPSEKLNNKGLDDLVTRDDVAWMDRKEAYARGLECLKKYLEKYPDTVVSLTGHSSGVKAAIDFAELMKKAGIQKKPNILGIDPVIDMTDAALEGAASQVGVALEEELKDPLGFQRTCRKFEDFINGTKTEKRNGAIKSRYRDELRKPSNVPYMITYYQQQDTVGLGAGGPFGFGIHGSPVHGAYNIPHEFESTSNQHHGMITQEEKVINSFREIINR